MFGLSAPPCNLLNGVVVTVEWDFLDVVDGALDQFVAREPFVGLTDREFVVLGNGLLYVGVAAFVRHTDADPRLDGGRLDRLRRRFTLCKCIYQ